MKSTFFPKLYILLFFTFYNNILSCFLLKNIPFFFNNSEFMPRTQKYGNTRTTLRLEKSASSAEKPLSSNINNSKIYEEIKTYLSNTSFLRKDKNNNANYLDEFICNFVSSPDGWNKVEIDDMNNNDIKNLINFLNEEYKRAFLSTDKKRKKAENNLNSENLKSLLVSLGSVVIDDMNLEAFYNHVEIYLLLLKFCKDNYVSFSFIKNEIVNIMNKIIKYSQNYLHDTHSCDKLKIVFLNMHELIKDIKKNNAIKVNIRNFLYILNSNIVLNNNNIFYFLTEIFSSLNLLVQKNPELVHQYEYIINPHFFFLCIFSLYSYNISKARFYYFLLLIHNQVNLTDLKEHVLKYDDNLNYSVYRNCIINTIFEEEKKKYESIKEIIVESENNATNIKKRNEKCIENLKDISNEKEKKIPESSKEQLLVKEYRTLLFKELYDNISIKILLFYVFFYFSDHYFCIIILLNFKNLAKNRNQDDRLVHITNYFFFILLDNLCYIRDYSKILLVLSLYKKNFISFNEKNLHDVKKIFNLVINNNIEEVHSIGLSNLLLEISESIKNVENEKKCINKNNVKNLCGNKNVHKKVHKNNIILKEKNEKEVTKIDDEHATEESGKPFVSNSKGKNEIISSSYMKDNFNNYLLYLLKKKAYDKIEHLEKRDNVYVNNKTYSLFIQSYLSNHKYDKVYKVYKKMKLKKNIPIKYLNVKNLIYSFKKCDIDKGDVLNELKLISKSYLNLYFSKDSYFVLTKTMLYKHICNYLKKKCDMNLIINIFNLNELIKYFIKFKSFINIRKLYFLLLKYSFIKTYKTYLILIRFFNNLNHEKNEQINMESEMEVGETDFSEDEKVESETNCPFKKNRGIYNDIINLRKKKLSYYIFKSKESKEDFNLYNKVYEIAKKDKYDMSLFILSNFITEYIFFDHPSDEILESELSNINNILNIYFESVNLFFHKQNYRITLNIFFFLLLFLNYYVTRYIKNDIKYARFLKQNAINFFLSNNYEIIKMNKNDIYAYIPNFILNMVFLSVNHLKNAQHLKELISMGLEHDSYDYNKNTIDPVNCKNIMFIFLLLKNNVILCNATMEKDIYDKQKNNNNNNNKKNITEIANVKIKSNYLYKDIIEKNYNEEKHVELNRLFASSNNVANVFVKLKYTIGSNKINEDSLKDFLFNKLKMFVSNRNFDSLINILKDIFFTYNNIIYLNSRDFLRIYENLDGIYDNVLSVLTIIIFAENNRNFKEQNALLSKGSEEHLEIESNEINIHEYIAMLRSMNKDYFKHLLNQKIVSNILKNYESFIHMCIYFDLSKKRVDNIVNFLEMLRKCNIALSTEILIDIFSLLFDRNMNNLIFNEFEIFSSSKKANNFELYYIVMKAAFFEENVGMTLKIFSIVLSLFNVRNIPLNFFECVLLILKKKGKFKDLYESTDKLHRELINFEKNKHFLSLDNLTLDVKSILNKYKREKQF
ncbi:conserved Plasmodium protein, unknown function [Plasmodium malariae]|uniref:Uncharacterized protein n=2 Tax=Plasmodium malariae TaxID=5858 RepID=A0A1D3JLT7_PLAMA|nr:conserved Plasmodium protein, unknown function [Plasmodium malariae]SBT87433.1 conserved Plasmodium protein, unknown function [Plasmodium malariae]